LTTRYGLENILRDQLRVQAEQLLSPIFGMSNLRVTASVGVNFDQVIVESVEFAPPIAGEMDGIVRSSEEMYENSRSRDIAEGIPGTDSNAMGTVEYPYGTLEDGYEYARAIISKNYEINETRTHIARERGKIERVGIAILVNSAVIEEDYVAEVTNLVAAGIGVSPANISVEYVPFIEDEMTDADLFAMLEEHEAAMRRQALVETIIQWVVILLLGISFMMLLRTIARTIWPPPEPEPLLVGAGAEGIDYLADEDVTDEAVYEDIDLQPKSSGLEQIERFIDKDAAAVAQLLRNWLTDE